MDVICTIIGNCGRPHTPEEWRNCRSCDILRPLELGWRNEIAAVAGAPLRSANKRRSPMELEPMEKEVREMIANAKKSATGDDAQRWSQAALNAANALRALNDIDISNGGRKPSVDT